MDAAGQRPGQDDAGMNVALLRAAMAMVDDAEAARALVTLALASAAEARAQGVPAAEANHFRYLRQAYHSIERSHSRRRMRDGLVTALAEQQARPSYGLGA